MWWEEVTVQMAACYKEAGFDFRVGQINTSFHGHYLNLAQSAAMGSANLFHLNDIKSTLIKIEFVRGFHVMPDSKEFRSYCSCLYVEL